MIAVVTGAFGNLGKAVVKKFIKEGYFVIGTAAPNEEASTHFPEDKFEKIIVDLGNEEESKKFIDAVIAKHHQIDAAILTAGGFAMGAIANTSTSDIYKQYKLNFETAYNPARYIFIQMMQQNNGRIFLIGSKPGLHAKNGKGMIAYSLSKSLIFHLAELMNDEAKEKNVVTTVVVPGTIDTAPNRKAMPDATFSNWVTPEEIANIIYWHCTNEANVLREPVLKVYNKA